MHRCQPACFLQVLEPLHSQKDKCLSCVAHMWGQRDPARTNLAICVPVTCIKVSVVVLDLYTRETDRVRGSGTKRATGCGLLDGRNILYNCPVRRRRRRLAKPNTTKIPPARPRRCTGTYSCTALLVGTGRSPTSTCYSLQTWLLAKGLLSFQRMCGLGGLGSHGQHYCCWYFCTHECLLVRAAVSRKPGSAIATPKRCPCPVKTRPTPILATNARTARVLPA